MLAIRGIYENGKVFLQEKVKTPKPVNVIVTFMENVQTLISNELDLARFSFNKTRELLKDYKGCISEAVIEERRSAV
ncbi:hypothetical protein KJ693_01630 [bacterium]|nr:hypothetical protein [bacterium]MBU1613991.1 hypothetical protein [bacterium]